jgi:hypothetical protein
MDDWIAFCLTLIYAALCVALVLIWARPQAVRPYHTFLPEAWFAPSRLPRLRAVWRDLALSTAGLAMFAFAQAAFASALGLLTLALCGLAALSVATDIAAQASKNNHRSR